MPYQSEIRDTQINELIDRVNRLRYQKYLRKVILKRVRGFNDEPVSFDFPVTALIGPNGGGKTTILGAAALAYTKIRPRRFFAKSGRLDESMLNWQIEWELVDRTINQRDVIHRTATFKQTKWYRDKLERDLELFGVARTVPANERIELQKCASNQFRVDRERITALTPNVLSAAEKILAKDMAGFQHVRVDDRGRVSLLTGQTAGGDRYSEFHFGAGESSVIRMVMAIEQLPDQSLILIEEIENGLHPVATARMVEYLIEVAERKRSQAIFTTHSNDALLPLPSVAIWASIDGKAFQGKLDIHALRAIKGEVDAQLAIFTEDNFASRWVATIVRAHGNIDLDMLEIHAMAGDGMAVSINRFHNQDPTRRFSSLAYIDGDSQQQDDGQTVVRLPGGRPESYIYDRVIEVMEEQKGILAVSLHLRYEDAERVAEVVRDVRRTNRDPHVLFSQVGKRLGLIPETTVRDAFLSVWSQAFPDEVARMAAPIVAALPADAQRRANE